MQNTTFTKQLIKGKIAETIFQNIFESSRKYLILPLGYENTNPVLRQFNYIKEINGMLKRISDTPDFALIHKEDNTVMLVEVKYRREISKSKLKSLAKGICENWKDTYIFLITQEDIYLDKCSSVKEIGEIQTLHTDIIDQKKQDQYLEMVREYIQN